MYFAAIRADIKERTQRMMLATWLVEIYLSKCNTLEDIVAAEKATSDVESLSIERQMMEEDMRNFMTTYQVGADLRYLHWADHAERLGCESGLRADSEPRSDGSVFVLCEFEEGSCADTGTLGDGRPVEQGDRRSESPGEFMLMSGAALKLIRRTRLTYITALRPS